MYGGVGEGGNECMVGWGDECEGREGGNKVSEEFVSTFNVIHSLLHWS